MLIGTVGLSKVLHQPYITMVDMMTNEAKISISIPLMNARNKEVVVGRQNKAMGIMISVNPQSCLLLNDLLCL